VSLENIILDCGTIWERQNKWTLCFSKDDI
jgi:hypothetical protein